MAKQPKKKPAKGRPPKPAGEARDTVLPVRLTAAERRLLDDAAKARSLDTSAWVRSEILALARLVLQPEPPDSRG